MNNFSAEGRDALNSADTSPEVKTLKDDAPVPDDPYAPVASVYDLSYGDFLDDVDFYDNLAQVNGSAVLELGAGTGRVAVPLAQAGYDVVGIDESPSMIAIARRRAERLKLDNGKLEFVEGDMRRRYARGAKPAPRLGSGAASPSSCC